MEVRLQYFERAAKQSSTAAILCGLNFYMNIEVTA